MQLVVGRIARAHGTGGEVAVEVRTDAVEERYAPGHRLGTDPDRGPLTVVGARWHRGRLLVRFTEITDRTLAETLRGTLLVADSADSPPAGESAWWDHELEGLTVWTTTGAHVGEVADVAHLPGGDTLVVCRPGGGEVLVPFVGSIVPVVDLATRRILIDPPEGLLEL